MNANSIFDELVSLFVSVARHLSPNNHSRRIIFRYTTNMERGRRLVLLTWESNDLVGWVLGKVGFEVMLDKTTCSSA